MGSLQVQGFSFVPPAHFSVPLPLPKNFTPPLSFLLQHGIYRKNFARFSNQSLNFSFPFLFLFFFVNFDISYFLVFLKASNINVNSIRKIGDRKIYALKVKRVPNTFENLNSFEMTLRMLKTMQIYQKYIFWGFHFFFLLFFNFSKNLSKIWVKNQIATMMMIMMMMML